MLKPKYRTLTESVSDFNRMLEGMNDVAPAEKFMYQEMDELVREEQELDRLELEFNHVESVIRACSAYRSDA